MTGPEHYSEAERLIEVARDADGTALIYPSLDDIARARVHATLALAAATALIDEKPRSGSFDQWREWAAVAAVTRKTGGAE